MHEENIKLKKKRLAPVCIGRPVLPRCHTLEEIQRFENYFNMFLNAQRHLIEVGLLKGFSKSK